MQALILAGGEGTRLRPLTASVPKPVVPFVDRPFIGFMLDWLRRHGVDDVVMSCGFMAAGVRAVLGDGSGVGVKLRYVEEPTPLGTGGALKYAEGLLDERFLMLNGDSLTDFDLSAQIATHERTGATGTLGLYPVEDPTRFGLVRLHDDGRVEGFLENPTLEQAAGTNTISAGMYVLERSVLELLAPDRPASIERDVFPRLVGQGLHGYVHEGYWLDIGTPATYLEGTWDVVEGRVASPVEIASDGVLVTPGAHVGDGVRLGPRAVLREGVSVGERTVLESCVLLPGARIGADCSLRDCVVGAGAVIGDGARVDGLSVLGEGVEVAAGTVLTDGAKVFPVGAEPAA